jgi:hypothetical protein
VLMVSLFLFPFLVHFFNECRGLVLDLESR